MFKRLEGFQPLKRPFTILTTALNNFAAISQLTHLANEFLIPSNALSWTFLMSFTTWDPYLLETIFALSHGYPIFTLLTKELTFAISC